MSANQHLADTAELNRFRQQWRAEVQLRKNLNTAPSLANDNAEIHHTASQQPLRTRVEPSRGTETTQIHPDKTPIILQGPSSLKGKGAAPLNTGVESNKSNMKDFHHANESDSSSNRIDKALVAYRKAVLAEQKGALEDAVQHYRKAFKLDAFVDSAYFREEQHIAQHISVTAKERHTYAGEDRPADDLESCTLRRDLEKLSLSTRGEQISGPVPIVGLASVMLSFPEQLSFVCEDDARKCPLSLLSEELLLLILAHLDTTSVERFALVNRKARLITSDSAIWRFFVRDTYLYPQVPVGYVLEDAIQNSRDDYRRFYIEHPRVRMDGVYIATCHYMRAGMKENVWVQPHYLITYHRYLRFFPDGQVICLRTNEDRTPQTIIPHLRSIPSADIHLHDMAIGRWRLVETDVIIDDITYVRSENRRHTFQMCLALRSKPMGRWNKLEFLTLNSVHVETGDAEPLSLKNERSFWFSKVRSYMYM